MLSSATESTTATASRGGCSGAAPRTFHHRAQRLWPPPLYRLLLSRNRLSVVTATVTNSSEPPLYTPSAELVLQGYNYGCHRRRADSALLCFSIAAGRYSRAFSREEKLC